MLIIISKVLHTIELNLIKQWSSRCTQVHTSVHGIYFRVHRKFSKEKKNYLDETCFVNFYGKIIL